MNPTPAQIEAALRELNRQIPPDGQIEAWDEVVRIALTAAAEVGEQDPAVEWVERVKHFEAADRQLKNATIERCAQVAKNWDGYGDPRDGIAAAIRALKDDFPRERTVIGVEWDNKP